jgi:hypothetical protein
MRGWGAAFLAVAAAAAGARAHEFSCVKTVNGEVVHEIRHYPARLHFKIRVTNTHPTESTALAVEDKLLQSLGFKFTPAVPFTLAIGQSVQSSFDVTVKSRAECEALAKANSCGGQLDSVFKVIHDVGETDCAARIVCGAATSCGEDEEGDHDGDHDHQDCDDEDDDDDDGHSVSGEGREHGLKFWSEHEQALTQCVAAGPVDLGIVTVRTLADFEGILWGSPAKSADGHPRGRIDKDRFLLARRLLAATCNVRLLGAKWERRGEAEDAVQALRGRKCGALESFDLDLENGRDCDGRHAIAEGPATPGHARSIAVDPTRRSADKCEEGER